MNTFIRRLFRIAPVSDAFLLRQYLQRDAANFALAKITLKEGEQTIGVYAPKSYRENEPLNYFYLTGSYADSGDTFVLTKETEAHLVWDRQPLRFTLTELLPHVLALRTTLPQGMRYPLWKDSKGRVWYFSKRSNVLESDRGRGYSFVLHRDQHEGEESEARYHVFYTNLQHFTSGTWLMDKQYPTPVYDPDHYTWVNEDDLIKEARHRFNLRYPTDKKLDMVLTAIARLSGDRLIEHPEIMEMERYRAEVLAELAHRRKAAIDDPRVHFQPSKTHQDIWGVTNYAQMVDMSPASSTTCADDASPSDRGDCCTSTDSPSDNPQE